MKRPKRRVYCLRYGWMLDVDGFMHMFVGAGTGLQGITHALQNGSSSAAHLYLNFF